MAPAPELFPYGARAAATSPSGRLWISLVLCRCITPNPSLSFPTRPRHHSLFQASSGRKTGSTLFCGEVQISRKHTRYAERDLGHLTARAVGQLGSKLENLDQRILSYNETRIDDQRAHDIVIRALDAGAITTIQVPDVLREWREPSHSEFLPRTAWSLFNAVTEVHKQLNPHTACRRGEALYVLFDSETRMHGRN